MKYDITVSKFVLKKYCYTLLKLCCLWVQFMILITPSNLNYTLSFTKLTAIFYFYIETFSSNFTLSFLYKFKIQFLFIDPKVSKQQKTFLFNSIWMYLHKRNITLQEKSFVINLIMYLQYIFIITFIKYVLSEEVFNYKSAFSSGVYLSGSYSRGVVEF